MVVLMSKHALMAASHPM
jgi:hypothetical protein